MPWHVHATLPDGRKAVANHDDPIVAVMRRAKHKPEPGTREDAQLTAWLDAHAEQSYRCQTGTCSHD